MSLDERTVSMSCPDLDELERFALEQGSPRGDSGATGVLADHLSSCPACRQRIAQVRENLDVLEPVRGAWQWRRQRAAGAAAPEVIGSYRILRLIGEGGMGSVFEAEQESPRRRVALKIIRPGRASATLLRRFRREMQVLGRLQHPGIAQIYEGGTHESPEGQVPYFVMELVNGPPLIEYARQRTLSVRDRLELMAKVCDAVEHAHERGVLHRDLKPGNILVSEPSGATSVHTAAATTAGAGAGATAGAGAGATAGAGAAQPKVLDFGVARVLGGDEGPALTTVQTDAHQLVGTIAYMSPEQVGGGDPRSLDARSDVYSLGVILYELLAGRLPYDAQSKPLPALLWSIAHEDAPPLRTVDSALGGDVDAIAAHALEKARDRRYRSAAEMADDLRRCLRDEPIVARPPSTLYQLRKFARRNRALVGAVAAALVVLTLGVIGTTAGMVGAQRARAVAEANAAKQAAVNRFLNDMLASADPRRLSPGERARGRDVTLLQALHAASARINAGTLRDQPGIELAVRSTIGTTYGQLGAYDAAEPHLRRALELAALAYGERHATYAECLLNLASVQHIRRQDEQAETGYRRALDVLRGAGGERSPAFADGLSKLGNFLRDQRRFDDAEAAFRQALELRRQLAGADHPDAARVLDELGQLFLEKAELDESHRYYSEALAIKRRALSEEHPDVATGLNQLGQILIARRLFKDAEPLIRQALEMRLKFYGEDNFEVGMSLNDLGVVLLELGRPDEAADVMRRALAVWRNVLGEAHPRAVTTANNLAMILLNTARPADAEPLLRDLLEQHRRAAPRDRLREAMLLNNLGGALRDQKKYAEAEAAFRDALEIRLKLLGEDDVDAALSRLNLAHVLRDRGRAADAEPMYVRVLAVFREQLGERHAYTANARAALGGCLHDRGQREQAVEHLVAALSVYRASLGDHHVRTTTVARRLVRLYDELGRADLSDPLRPLLDPPATAPATVTMSPATTRPATASPATTSPATTPPATTRPATTSPGTPASVSRTAPAPRPSVASSIGGAPTGTAPGLHGRTLRWRSSNAA